MIWLVECGKITVLHVRHACSVKEIVKEKDFYTHCTPHTNAFFVHFCLTSSIKQRHEMNKLFEVLRRKSAINAYFCLQYFLSVCPSLLLRQLMLILYSYRPETILLWVKISTCILEYRPGSRDLRCRVSFPYIQIYVEGYNAGASRDSSVRKNSSFFQKPVFALSRVFSVRLLLHASKTISSFYFPRSRYKIERLKVHECCLLLFPVIREFSRAFNSVSEPIRRDHL